MTPMELSVDRFIFSFTLTTVFLISTISPAWSQTNPPPDTRAATGKQRPSTASQNPSSIALDRQTKNEQLAAVYQELSKMVPGGVPEGSQLETSLKETISLFADQEPAKAKQSMKDLSAKEKTFPPANLMLSALAFAINDNLSGKRLLEQAAIVSPQYPDVNLSFGQLALVEQRFSDAEAQAELALQKINSGSFAKAADDHFKQRYHEIKFQTAKARNKTDEAKKILKQLDSIAPNSQQALIGKAEFAFQDNDIDQAIVLLNQLNAVSDGDPQVPQLTIASWFQRSGKPENADLWIRKAAAENEKNVDVQLAAARWAMNRENFREALQTIGLIESNFEASNTTQEMRGKIAFAQGAFETAGAQFEKLLAGSPNNIDYANLLSLAMVQNTDPETRKRAARLAQKVAAAEPNNAVALSSLAYTLLKTGETESARSVLSKVIQMPNQTAEVRFIIAYMLSETGQMPQSEKLLKQLMERKGLFLFRSEAEKLLKKVSQSIQALPERGE